jgi:hypothetical protein
MLLLPVQKVVSNRNDIDLSEPIENIKRNTLVKIIHPFSIFMNGIGSGFILNKRIRNLQLSHL